MHFKGNGILLDIEGTTSSIRFVYDVMFPYVRTHLRDYLERAWDAPEPAEARDLIARDAGHDSFAAWNGGGTSKDTGLDLVVDEVERLMDGDVKATGLKQLQGLIWHDGFASGELIAQVYDDVPEALKRWQQASLDVRIYSSGSIAAQKLFFGHSEHSDLLHYFKGHYDTTIGGKKESDSFTRICADMNQPPEQVLFVSDVLAELDAACAAGLQTALSVRPENPPVDADHSHPVVTDFSQIEVSSR
jgi:enolase-phosphatase E1